MSVKVQRLWYLALPRWGVGWDGLHFAERRDQTASGWVCGSPSLVWLLEFLQPTDLGSLLPAWEVGL